MTSTLRKPSRAALADALADAPRAAVYCRISDDRGGEGLGVERQRQDCTTLAERSGWKVVHIFTDNDLSAYSGKPRPQYAALMAAVEAGEIDVVAAWDPDRLHRSPAELETFIAAIERASVAVYTVQAGEWDLTTANGRLHARMLGAVARHESEHKSERVRRALQQRAESGRSHGRRAYGWLREHAADGTVHEVIEPAEAAVVQRIADALLSGDSLRSVTVSLNAEGVPSPTGKPWGKNMVRALVLRARNAGLRVHRGEIVGEGAWEAILDRGRWEQLRAVLSDPQRRTSTGTAAAHLLSGVARCGVCGATLRVAQNRGVPSYRCSADGCVIRRKADLDHLIVGLVTARLARPDAASLFAPDDSAERSMAHDEAERLRGRLDHAADQYAEGLIDGRQMERITAKLRPLLADAERRARVVDPAPLLDGLAGAGDVAAAWDDLPLSRRRAVVDTLMTITLNRTRQGARRFDPDAVAIAWKQPGA